MKKKILVFALILIMTVSLTGCKGKEPVETEELKKLLIDAFEEEAKDRIAKAKSFDYYTCKIPENIKDKTYPEKFDLRSVDTNGDGVYENYVTSVKYQLPLGTCWAFSAISAAETSILYDLKKEAIEKDENGNLHDSLDLSEHHLAWFTYTPLLQDDEQAGEGLYSQIKNVKEVPGERLNSGSSQFAAASMFASGIGPIIEPDEKTANKKEAQLNYHGADYSMAYNNVRERYDYTVDDDWSVDEDYRFSQSYRLEDAYLLPSSVKYDDNGNYDLEYAQDVVNVYKNQLVQGRAIAIIFRDASAKARKYINPETWAQYCYKHETGNHAVTIVGYDDNFSKDNFLSEVKAKDDNDNEITVSVDKPPKDGAWIVKNSYGSIDSVGQGENYYNWGIDGSGYFYLSYYDQSICSAQCFDFDVTDKLGQNLGVYELEEYDLLPTEFPHAVYVDKRVATANGFKATQDETIKALSCTTTVYDENVEFYVYKSKDENEDYSLLGHFNKTYENPGLHVLELSDYYSIKEGEYIIVAIVQKVEDQYLISVGSDYNQKGYDAGYCDDNYAAKAIVNPDESYIYFLDDDVWIDFKEIKDIIENGHTYTSYLTYDNFPIKIYASIDN